MNIEDRLLSLCQGKGKTLPCEISAVCTDSRKVVPGSVFVALKGRTTDGHNYLKAAVEKGAQVLVVERAEQIQNIPFKGMVCTVPDTHEILSVLLNEFYGFPSEKMFCVGITGTNGKTTISNTLSFLFSHCGWRTGSIGTIQNQFGGWREKSMLTTPDPSKLYRLLDRFYSGGAQAVVMEVSSIGLDQQRVKGVDFNLGVFTNLSEDHLDYHSDMSSYFQAKKKLFEVNLLSMKTNHFLAVLNLDDPYGVTLAREIQVPYISYGRKGARFSWDILSDDLKGTLFKLYFDKKEMDVYLPIPGIYNVSNAVAALCCVYAAGFPLEEAVQALKSFPGVPGRMQRVCPDRFPLVFVDYAHTPKALEAVLSLLQKKKARGSRLLTVFGCGGQRDQEKRPLMAQVVERFSDQVFLTSDNPREEDPLNIVADCMKGVSHKEKCIVELDRKKAIRKALECSQKEDVILIAGKGHEREQIIGVKRHPFSDEEVVKEFFG